VAVISDPGANSLRRSSRRARYRDVNRKRYERLDDMNGLDRSRQRAPRHLIAAISPFATTASRVAHQRTYCAKRSSRGAAIERLCVTFASQAARRAGAVVGAVVIPVAAAAVVLLASAHLF
jgi:hypothetical protein